MNWAKKFMELAKRYNDLKKENQEWQEEVKNLLAINHQLRLDLISQQPHVQRMRYCRSNQITGQRAEYILKYGVEAAEVILSYRGKIGAQARSKAYWRSHRP